MTLTYVVHTTWAKILWLQKTSTAVSCYIQSKQPASILIKPKSLIFDESQNSFQKHFSIHLPPIWPWSMCFVHTHFWRTVTLYEYYRKSQPSDTLLSSVVPLSLTPIGVRPQTEQADGAFRQKTVMAALSRKCPYDFSTPGLVSRRDGAIDKAIPGPRYTAGSRVRTGSGPDKAVHCWDNM